MLTSHAETVVGVRSGRGIAVAQGAEPAAPNLVPVGVSTRVRPGMAPGPGGFGVVMLSGNKRKEISQGFRLTTNNRMELLSVIVALEALKKPQLDVTIFSDSRYVVDSVNKGWVFEWNRKNFQKKKKR